MKKKNASNLIEAKIRDVIYNGTFTRLIVVFEKKEIKINIEVTEDYKKGDIVYLDIDEDWAVVIGSDKS